jgi:integrase
LYGAGLRLNECLSLRVKDIDFGYKQIVVRDGKGNKDRVTMLPVFLVDSLKRHLEKVKILHERDLKQGFGMVTCLTHWRESTEMPTRSGDGSMFFLQPLFQLIRGVNKDAGITYRRASCKKQ